MLYWHYFNESILFLTYTMCFANLILMFKAPKYTLTIRIKIFFRHSAPPESDESFSGQPYFRIGRFLFFQVQVGILEEISAARQTIASGYGLA